MVKWSPLQGSRVDETAEHILCTCDAISFKRLLYLGKANLTPEEVVSVAPRQVLNFYGRLELPLLTKGHITKVIKGTSP